MFDNEDYQYLEDQTWIVESDCKAVKVESVVFKTAYWGPRDILTIEGIEYSKKSSGIDQYVHPTFTVDYIFNHRMLTGDGFKLTWSCVDIVGMLQIKLIKSLVEIGDLREHI